ncbi:MAG: hypothetical protein CL534_18860 [Ahrensia sp.]|nr:hypothetical protein [Ahrensia sp.]
MVAIALADGSYCFGRVLAKPLIAFYDLNSLSKDVSLETVLKSRVLFRIWVMNRALSSRRWPVVGHASLENELLAPPVFFRRDAISGKFSLYYQGGTEEPATREMCEGLECAAVWDPEHVEDRLLDHYRGVPNKWVESLNRMLQPD